MKKHFILTMALFVVLSMTIFCLIVNKDILTKDKSNLSKSPFKLGLQGAYMSVDYGIYSETENEMGIVVRGNVESGKIKEGSQIIFVDENGKVLYNDKVFKIVIIETDTGSAREGRLQSYAKSGDNVVLYLKAWNGNDTALYDIYEKNLELIRESQFAVK